MYRTGYVLTSVFLIDLGLIALFLSAQCGLHGSLDGISYVFVYSNLLQVVAGLGLADRRVSCTDLLAKNCTDMTT